MKKNSSRKHGGTQSRKQDIDIVDIDMLPAGRLQNVIPARATLPPELLLRAFNYFWHAEELLPMAAVCQQWRKLVLASETFWGTVHYFEWDKLMSMGERSLLDAQLANRPMHAPWRLAVRVRTEGKFYYDTHRKDRQHNALHQLILPRMMAESRLLTQLVVVIPWVEKAVKLLSTFRVDALTSFELVILDDRHATIPENIFAGHAPKLLKLKLDGIELSYGGHYPAFDTVTSISYTYGLPRKLLTAFRAPFPRALLRFCHYVEDLHLAGFIDPIQRGCTKRLKTLDVRRLTLGDERNAESEREFLASLLAATLPETVRLDHDMAVDWKGLVTLGDVSAVLYSTPPGEWLKIRTTEKNTENDKPTEVHWSFSSNLRTRTADPMLDRVAEVAERLRSLDTDLRCWGIIRSAVPDFGNLSKVVFRLNRPHQKLGDFELPVRPRHGPPLCERLREVHVGFKLSSAVPTESERTAFESSFEAALGQRAAGQKLTFNYDWM